MKVCRSTRKKWFANALIKCPLSCTGEELPRSHINLRFHHCPEKGLECQIPGCKRIVKRKEMEKHLLDSAMSHLKMQSAEIQRLRREIHEKDRENSTHKLEEKSAGSFDWEVEQCGELTRPITSDTFSTGENKWRCLITEKTICCFSWCPRVIHKLSRYGSLRRKDKRRNCLFFNKQHSKKERCGD